MSEMKSLCGTPGMDRHPGISAVFLNPNSRDYLRPNPTIFWIKNN